MFLGSNLLTGLLGLLAVSGYVAVYTPLKRVSGAALFVGAVPGALPPLMGWTAVTGRLDAARAWRCSAILFLWQIPHFLAIAIYRADDYARAGFKVLPLTLSAAHDARDDRRVLGRAGRRDHRAASRSTWRACATRSWRRCSARCSSAGPRLGFRRARAASRWARSLFLYSIVYLTLLFVALAIDRVPSGFPTLPRWYGAGKARRLPHASRTGA